MTASPRRRTLCAEARRIVLATFAGNHRKLKNRSMALPIPATVIERLQWRKKRERSIQLSNQLASRAIVFASGRFFQAFILLYEITLVYHLHEQRDVLAAMDFRDQIANCTVVSGSAEEFILREKGKDTHLVKICNSSLTLIFSNAHRCTINELSPMAT